MLVDLEVEEYFLNRSKKRRAQMDIERFRGCGDD